MYKYWINRLLGNPTVRVLGPGTALLYREDRRAIQIGVQMLTNGYAIDIGTIISWDDKPEQILSDYERRRIANAVKDVVESQWGETVEIRDGR